MGVFNKIVNILFDEPEEIPVITKDSSPEIQEEIKHEKFKSEPKQDKREEVIVTKIEKKPVEDDMFDMPKFNEDAKTDSIKKSAFTFPLIDDDDFEVKEDEKRSARKREKEEKRSSRRHDYLSAFENKDKRKADNDRGKRTTTSLYETSSKKPFTLSPIISPVYGVLNENYKKEDISFRDSSNNRVPSGKVDFESVRRKAYGTLEDEIESSLKKEEKEDVLEEVPNPDKFSLDNLKDDGLSINDLLVDDDTSNSMNDEIFDIDTEIVQKEIDIDDEEEIVPEKVQKEIDIDDEEEIVPEKVDKEVKDETPLEDDLFDLIDSIYAGKEEE